MKQIMKGAEPFFFPGDEIGCLLAHGFTATPQEVRELGERLAQDGRTVLGVRLFGHGTEVSDLPHARWKDWLASVEDGYHLLKDICNKIVFLGFSTGGAISLLLAKELPALGAIIMSTPHELPQDPRIQLLRPIIRPLSLLYPYTPKGPSDFFDPRAAEERVQYHHYPLRAVPELDTLFAKMREILPALRLPVLFIHSKDDRFVPPEHMHANFDLLGFDDKKKVLVEGSNHTITCDAAKEKVFTEARDFVRRLAGLTT
jgi:carboxylesterase